MSAHGPQPPSLAEDAWVHAAVARRTDPDLAAPCGPMPEDVADLHLTLRPTPGGFYAITAKAYLFVLGEPGQRVAIASFMVREGRRTQAPWRAFTLPPSAAEGIRVQHTFAGIPGDGAPIAFGLAIKTASGQGRYSVGHISVLAEREFPITAQPGIGWTLRLA